MMPTKSVLIPTVANDENDSRLLTVYAEIAALPLSEDAREALGKNLSVIAHPLSKQKLYRAGNAAAEFVRAFILHRRGSIWQKFKYNSRWLDKHRLHSTGDSEGDSSQLGLALALLLNTRPPVEGVIATGKLGGIEGKISVDRVGGIPQKIAVVLKARQEGKLPEKRYLFFTPVDYVDEQGRLLEIAQLETVKQLAQMNITVMPISQLGEVVEKLGLLPGFRDYKLIWGAAIFLCATAMAGYSLNKPIDLQFEPIKPGFGNKPFLTCQKENARRVDYYPIKADGYANVVDGFATTSAWNRAINWKVVLPQERGPGALLQELWRGYYLSYVNVGERTGLKADTMPGKFIGGQVWSRAWQLKEPAEEQNNLLMLLASRRPLDLVGFENAFNRRFQTRPIDLTSARNYIAQQVPGTLPFIYQVKKTEHPCDE